MSTENQLAQRPQSVKDYLALAAYKDRFQEVLGKRANQFMAAITASSNLPGLKDAEPRSVIAAAMVAATLDLPINPTLGMAHIVAYGDGNGNKVAQFQCGYKGFIQLALRSGQYKRLNAGPVSGSVFKGYDIVGEPVLDWSSYDPLSEVTGYFCAFETLNGFTKVVYWTKAQCEAHAKRFSKAYAKGYSTPWKSDFDSMATKTVIKAALTKWGIMSVEMQKVATHDQGAQEDVDAEVKYVDGADKTVGEPDAIPGDPVTRPEPPKRERKVKGANAIVEAETSGAESAATTVVPPTQPPVDNAHVAEGATPFPVEHVEKQAEAKPAPAPRAFLKDKEQVVAVCEVVELTAININNAGVITPSVQASVKGDFVGTVYHIGGGERDGDGVRPAAPWAKGATLRLALIGKLNTKAQKVQTFVESAAVAEQDGVMEV